MSKLWIDLTIAFRSLVQHTRRTLFLGSAIAAVTMLLILLTGVSTGVHELTLAAPRPTLPMRYFEFVPLLRIVIAAAVSAK